MVAAPLFGQSDTVFLNRAINSLDAYSVKNPVEKVYLQVDKNYYAAGDDIWFKAYLTMGSRHELSEISSVLNVELINNDKGLIEQSVKLPVVSGLTWGDFKLPDTLKEGLYTIRAYTKWMRNAGTEYFFDKTINVGNAIMQNVLTKKESKLIKQKQHSATQKIASDKTDIQFFPESGSLVYGLASRVAFKAIGSDGLGKDIKGVVVDDQNHEIIQFSSRHLGMGVFNLLPVNGKTYKAIITLPDGSVNTIKLPLPSVSGYVLHIKDADSLTIEVKIEASRDLIQTNQGINLIAQSGNQVYYAAKSNSMSSSFFAIIPKNKFPSGIVQFTLFSSNGEPLNERLVFIKNNDQLKLSIAAGGNFSPRGKTRINFSAKNQQGQPVFGNFSVAVVDETKAPVNEAAESGIFSSLLLTSDIKGYIEQPGYYFAAANDHTNADLDILMLTQGYHRFEWKQILTSAAPPIVYQPEASLEITGYLKTLSGKPVPNGKISLLSANQSFFLRDTVSNSSGYFAFKNLQFKNSTRFVIQSKTKKDSKNLSVQLDTLSPPVMRAQYSSVPTLNPNDSLSAYLASSKKIYDEQRKDRLGNYPKILNEVTITALKPVLTNSSNFNGAGNADQVVLFKNIKLNCGSIAECLIGKLTGVFFKYDYANQYYYPCTYVEGKTVVMNIMVDGMIMNPETFSTLPPAIVESVDVLKSGGFTSIYGENGYTGLLLINTKKGGSANYTTANIVTYIPKGYYKAREFYAPRYDDPKTNTKMADLRSTIYWNPNVATDAKGAALFEYFNADGPGTYCLIAEGIDKDGNIGRQVYRYTVK